MLQSRDSLSPCWHWPRHLRRAVLVGCTTSAHSQAYYSSQHVVTQVLTWRDKRIILICSGMPRNLGPLVSKVADLVIRAIVRDFKQKPLGARLDSHGLSVRRVLRCAMIYPTRTGLA